MPGAVEQADVEQTRYEQVDSPPLTVGCIADDPKGDTATCAVECGVTGALPGTEAAMDDAMEAGTAVP